MLTVASIPIVHKNSVAKAMLRIETRWTVRNREQLAKALSQAHDNHLNLMRTLRITFAAGSTLEDRRTVGTAIFNLIFSGCELSPQNINEVLRSAGDETVLQIKNITEIHAPTAWSPKYVIELEASSPS